MLIPIDRNWRGPFPDGFSATVLLCRCSYIFSLCRKKKRRRTGGCVIPAQRRVTNEEVVLLAVNWLFSYLWRSSVCRKADVAVQGACARLHALNGAGVQGGGPLMLLFQQTGFWRRTARQQKLCFHEPRVSYYIWWLRFLIWEALF